MLGAFNIYLPYVLAPHDLLHAREQVHAYYVVHLLPLPALQHLLQHVQRRQLFWHILRPRVLVPLVLAHVRPLVVVVTRRTRQVVVRIRPHLRVRVLLRLHFLHSFTFTFCCHRNSFFFICLKLYSSVGAISSCSSTVPFSYISIICGVFNPSSIAFFPSSADLKYRHALCVSGLSSSIHSHTLRDLADGLRLVQLHVLDRHDELVRGLQLLLRHALLEILRVQVRLHLLVGAVYDPLLLQLVV